MDSHCLSCNAPVSEDAFFCSQCGKAIKEKPLSTTVLTQLGIYLLSVFLPPLGLWPGIKYVRRSDRTARYVGLAAIMLTVISTAVTLWLTYAFLNVYLGTLQSAIGGGLYQ